MLAVQQHQVDMKHDRVILSRAGVEKIDQAAHEEARMLAVQQNLRERKRQQVALSRSLAETLA